MSKRKGLSLIVHIENNRNNCTKLFICEALWLSCIKPMLPETVDNAVFDIPVVLMVVSTEIVECPVTKETFKFYFAQIIFFCTLLPFSQTEQKMYEIWPEII